MNELQILGLAASRLEPQKVDYYRQFIMGFRGNGQELFQAFTEKRNIPKQLFPLALPANLMTAEKDLAKWARQNILVMGLGEKHYPQTLAQIHKPPTFISYIGKLPDDFTRLKTVAIIGSRRSDVEGEKIGTSFAASLAASGACIISGLARGVDAAAHRGSLQAKSEYPTIAVLGNGLDTIYPPGNRDLARKILEQGGLLLSQFEAGEKPYPWNFLARNRIIAALSQAVLVIQAGERSGSLVTARFALEFGKEVLVVPGSILSQRYVGSNRLIQQGATPALAPDDVREAVPALAAAVKTGSAGQESQLNCSSSEHEILALLRKSGALSFVQIQDQLGGPKGLISDIFELELQGLLERRPGNLIALKKAV